MNNMMRFGAFVLLVTMGFYAGEINSSLLGVNLTTASQEVVNLFKIGFWAVGLGVLFNLSEVFN